MNLSQRIIKANDKAYWLVTTAELPHDCDDRSRWIEEMKKRYDCTTVLLNQGLYYFCEDIIDAEFEEIKGNNNE